MIISLVMPRGGDKNSHSHVVWNELVIIVDSQVGKNHIKQKSCSQDMIEG